MFTIRMLKPAAKELEKLDKSTGRSIVKRIKWLSQNLNKIKLERLKGDLANFYKLREGDYRIIYEILHKEKVIMIHSIGHRREVYKKR